MINQFAYYKPTCELIDTLWNVNFVLNKGKHTWKEELIDTLWNVNFFIKRIPDFILRINRYIMECKLCG